MSAYKRILTLILAVVTAFNLSAVYVYAGSIDIKIGGAGIGLSTDDTGSSDTGGSPASISI